MVTLICYLICIGYWFAGEVDTYYQVHTGKGTRRLSLECSHIYGSVRAALMGSLSVSSGLHV